MSVFTLTLSTGPDGGVNATYTGGTARGQAAGALQLWPFAPTQPGALHLESHLSAWATSNRSQLAHAGWAALGQALQAELDQGWRPRLIVEATTPEAAALPVECLPLAPQAGPLVQAGADRARVAVQHRVPGLASQLDAAHRGAPRELLLAWSEAGGEVHGHTLATALHTAFERRGVRVHTLANPDLPTLAGRLDALPELDTLVLLAHGGDPAQGPATWLGLDAARPTPALDLVEALAPHAPHLARVALLSCDSGDGAQPLPALQSLARALHTRGLDTVLAPRWRLGRGAAHALCQVWLEALLDGLDAAAALALARHAPQVQALRDRLAVQVYQHEGPPPPDPQGLKARLAEQMQDLSYLASCLDARQRDRQALSRVGVRVAARPTLSRVGVRVDVHACAPGAGRPVHPAEDRALSSVLGPPGGRWVLQGAPGSGKTTLLRQLVQELCADPHWLPLLLRAADLRTTPVAQALRARRDEAWVRLWESWPADRRLVLVDGLDEASDPQDPDALPRALQDEAAALGAGTFLVAGRPEAFPTPWPGFGELQLCPLKEPEQAQLLANLGVPPAPAAEALRALRARPRLRELAERPLLLTLAGLLLLEGKPLPERRVDLFRDLLAILLHRHKLTGQKQRVVKAADVVEQALEHLAPRLRALGPGPWTTAQVRAALEEDPRLCARLRAEWPEDTLQRFLDENHERVGILTRDADERWAFPHASLGEYLASRGLVRDPALRQRAVEAALQHPERWAETLALTAGQLDADDPAGETYEADALLRRLLAHGERARPLVFPVLAEARRLREGTVEEVLNLEQGWDRCEARREVITRIPELVGDPAVAVRVLEQVRRRTRDGNDLYWVREALRGLAAQDAARVEAELALGRLFEHIPGREEATAAVEATQVRIPAGSFVMGDDASPDEDEKPAHSVEIVRDFRLMKVPVTWALYLRFDPGHAAAQEDFEGTLPTGMAQEHVPVYRVSWYAAVMFAEWVGQRLPTEAEWEYACRGQRERSARRTRYWSGDSEKDLARVGWYGNLDDLGGNSGRHPHPVPHPEANPFGLHDMHGNVWEWCLDWYQGDVYKARRPGVKLDPWGEDGREPTLQVGNGLPQSAESAARGVGRVVRGGSWDDVADGARAAYRFVGRPTYSDTNVGFRLAVAVPPQPGPGS